MAAFTSNTASILESIDSFFTQQQQQQQAAGQRAAGAGGSGAEQQQGQGQGGSGPSAEASSAGAFTRYLEAARKANEQAAAATARLESIKQAMARV